MFVVHCKMYLVCFCIDGNCAYVCSHGNDRSPVELACPILTNEYIHSKKLNSPVFVDQDQMSGGARSSIVT